MEVTRTLARYVVDSQTSDIPGPVRREAVRSLVNWLGCAVGGCRHEAVDRALAALSIFFRGHATPMCSGGWRNSTFSSPRC